MPELREIPLDVLQERPVVDAWAQSWSLFSQHRAEVRSVESEGRPGTLLALPSAAYANAAMLGGIGHFKHMPAMVEQVRRMGFDWPEGDRITVFPTPATFAERLQRHGIEGQGFAITWVLHDGGVLPQGPWLLRSMNAHWTAHAWSPSMHARVRSDPAANREMRFALDSLAHDMTVHALNYHLVPRHVVADLAARIRTAFPEKVARWSDDAASCVQISYYWDNDFNRYCYAVWCRTESPRQFAGIFLKPANLEQLYSALEVRMDEVRRGLDAVPGGMTEHMPEPTPTSFEMR